MIEGFIRRHRAGQQFVASSQALLRAGALGAVLSRWLPNKDEFAALSPASRYAILGLGALVVLVVVATVSAVVAVELSAADLPWLRPRPVASPTTESRNAETYSHIAARSVFARSRQAQPVSADNSLPPAPVAATALDQSMVLRGVFMSGPSAKAFLTSTQNPAGNWVHLNGEFSGWRLVDVKPEQVLLEGQGEKLALKLSVTK